MGSQTYIASIDVDSTGRYLYYIPGADGGAEKDGTPVVQFDTRTRQRKVLCVLHPFYQETDGCASKGTYSVALDAQGKTLFVTWNASRGGKNWTAPPSPRSRSTSEGERKKEEGRKGRRGDGEECGVPSWNPLPQTADNGGNLEKERRCGSQTTTPMTNDQ